MAGSSSGEVLALVGVDSGVPPKSKELLFEDRTKAGANGAASRGATSRSPALDDMDPG